MKSGTEFNLNNMNSLEEDFLRNSGVIFHSRNRQNKSSLAVLDERTMVTITILMTGMSLNGIDLDLQLKKILEENNLSEVKILESRNTLTKFMLSLKTFAVNFEKNTRERRAM